MNEIEEDKLEQTQVEDDVVSEAAVEVLDEDTDLVDADQVAKDAAYSESMRAVVMGEVMNEWPQDLFIPPDALEVVLDSFEGPLDLLLYLIRKQNLDILNIPVA